MVSRIGGPPPHTPRDGFSLVQIDDENETPLVEHEIPLAPFDLNEGNFGLNANKGPDSIEIVMEGRRIQIIGISEEEQFEEFQRELGIILQPAVNVDELKAILDQFLAEQPEGALRSKILEKSEHLLDTLSEFKPFALLEMIEIVLGEEIYKHLSKRIPIKWKIPRENVPKLHHLIKSSDQEDFEAVFEKYREIKEYLIEEDSFPLLIPFTKTLHGWPRVERVKQALRTYFQIENRVKSGSEELDSFLKEDGNEILLAPIEDLWPNRDDNFDPVKLDMAAMHSLETVCFEVQLQIQFQKNGRQIILGAPKNDHFDHAAYARELSDSRASTPVLVDDFEVQFDDES